MNVLAVHHVQLPFLASHGEAIREFYGRLLGLPCISHPTSDRPSFMAGSQRLDLVPVERPEPPARLAHVALEVLNLPELRRRLLAAGLPLDETRPLPGFRRLCVNDPAGNRLEFLEPEPDGVWTP